MTPWISRALGAGGTVSLGVFAMALTAAAPAAAAPNDAIAVAGDVSFSAAELTEALNVRGVDWSMRIRVRRGPAGVVVVMAGETAFAVALEGRQGAAAARVVAIALIGEFGTEETAQPSSTAMTMAPPSSSPRSRQPVVREQPEAKPATTKSLSQRRVLTFGPSVMTWVREDIDGSSLGLAFGGEFFARGMVRLDASMTVYATHLRVATAFGNLVGIEDRPVTARVGGGLRWRFLSFKAGPQLELHTYRSSSPELACSENDDLLIGAYASAQGVLPLGRHVGLFASATASTSFVDQDTFCVPSMTLPNFVSEPKRGDLEMTLGVAYGL